jgi:hypothetical protein
MVLMPRVSFFYGIAIYMYWNERDHPVPHFHAIQAEREASISVDGMVLAGELDRRAINLVREWARLHREELLANWERAGDRQPIHPITPLP